MMKKLLLKSYIYIRRIVQNERGIALTEAIVTMAVTAMVISAFLFSMSTTSKAVMISQELVTAENLAKSQIEYTRSQLYDEVHNPPEYLTLDALDIPAGFTVLITAERLDPKGDGTQNDDGLQSLTAIVNYNGVEAFRLQNYRMKR